ncbi:MAG: toxin-antitoxin system YwqK family antitoxin [Bacteroidota bacterium]
MNSKIITLLLWISLISCNYQNPEDGNYIYSYRENGKELHKLEFIVKNNDTILQGDYLVYDDNENLIFAGICVDNLLHGSSVSYFPNGNKQTEGDFKRNMLDGNVVHYYNNDSVESEKIEIIENYREDVRVLGYYHFRENSSIDEYKFYDHKGELIYSEFYDEDGNISESEGRLVPNIIIGNSIKNNKLTLNDDLIVHIYFIIPPDTDYRASTRIVGLDEEWNELQEIKKDEVYNYKRTIDTLGKFRFEINYQNSRDDKEYINGFDFEVVL